MAKCTLKIRVEYDESVTDPESLAVALDRLLETALSTPGVMDDYGSVLVGEFLVDSGERCDECDADYEDMRRNGVLIEERVIGRCPHGDA